MYARRLPRVGLEVGAEDIRSVPSKRHDAFDDWVGGGLLVGDVGSHVVPHDEPSVVLHRYTAYGLHQSRIIVVVRSLLPRSSRIAGEVEKCAAHKRLNRLHHLVHVLGIATRKENGRLENGVLLSAVYQ